MTPEQQRAIGKRFADWRRRQGWTQADVESKFGVNRAYYGHVEVGKANLSLRQALKLAATFGLDAEWVTRGILDWPGGNDGASDEASDDVPVELARKDERRCYDCAVEATLELCEHHAAAIDAYVQAAKVNRTDAVKDLVWRRTHPPPGAAQ